jgi:predicted transcriptional regulator
MFKNRRFKGQLETIDNDIRDLMGDLEKEDISEHDRVLTLEQIAIMTRMRIRLIDNKKYV